MTAQKAQSALSFIPPQKICTLCKINKPIELFGKHKQGKNGIHPHCKTCVNERSKVWTVKNKARKNATTLAWNKANPDKIKSAKKKYSLTDNGKATVNAANTAYRAAHPERVAAWAAASNANPATKENRVIYKRANRHKSRAYQQNRRARQLSAHGTHTAEDVKNLISLQRGRCACCKVKLSDYHVDHITPLSRNGGNGPDNLQILCPKCNVQKQARDPIKFMQSRGFLL